MSRKLSPTVPQKDCRVILLILFVLPQPGIPQEFPKLCPFQMLAQMPVIVHSKKVGQYRIIISLDPSLYILLHSLHNVQNLSNKEFLLKALALPTSVNYQNLSQYRLIVVPKELVTVISDKAHQSRHIAIHWWWIRPLQLHLNKKLPENLCSPINHPLNKISSQILYLNTWPTAKKPVEIQSQLAQRRENIQQLQKLNGVLLTLSNCLPKLKKRQYTRLRSYLRKATHPHIQSNPLKHIIAKLILSLKQMLHSKLQMLPPLSYIPLNALYIIELRHRNLKVIQIQCLQTCPNIRTPHLNINPHTPIQPVIGNQPPQNRLQLLHNRYRQRRRRNACHTITRRSRRHRQWYAILSQQQPELILQLAQCSIQQPTIEFPMLRFAKILQFLLQIRQINLISNGIVFQILNYVFQPLYSQPTIVPQEPQRLLETFQH
ncbi:hypothetical protein V8G54_037208 [Vigna mungo]|uniref:Uncharacterized protein n=1 Tax=Vigna mungo TaxID=3915 RepID=A0AAQ3MJV4_VIGMU